MVRLIDEGLSDELKWKEDRWDEVSRARRIKLTRNRRSNEGNAKAITSSRSEPLASFLPRIAAPVRSRTTAPMPSWDPTNVRQIPSLASEPTSPPVKAEPAEQEYHHGDDQ